MWIIRAVTVGATIEVVLTPFTQFNPAKSPGIWLKLSVHLGKMRCMTRSDLITALASHFPNLVEMDAEVAVKELLDAIGTALVQGNRVEVRGFGTFSLNFRAPRIGRNPKTGETVLVPAKYVPHFKAGKEMREGVEHSVKPSLIKRAA